jgi:cold shock protein
MTKPLLTGVLKTWKEDRGFGFIVPDNGGRDVFLHISAIAQPSRRPLPGDVIHYQLARDKHGKFRAVNVSIEGVTNQDTSTNSAKTGKSRLGWIILLLIVGVFIYMYWRSGGFAAFLQ